jgi:hypothetical protein
MTVQGHPRAIFKRAIERGNLVAAELAAREVGRLTIEEALWLVVLYAEAEPAKFERAALRSHARFVDQASPSLLRAQVALAALSELRSGNETAKTCWWSSRRVSPIWARDGPRSVGRGYGTFVRRKLSCWLTGTPPPSSSSRW